MVLFWRRLQSASVSSVLQHFDVYVYLPVAFILPAVAIWVSLAKRDFPYHTPSQRQHALENNSLELSLYAISAIAIFRAYQVGRNAAQIAPLMKPLQF